MEKKTTKATLWSALSDFQEECPAINKGAKGYGYKYADLPSIMEVINPCSRNTSSLSRSHWTAEQS